MQVAGAVRPAITVDAGAHMFCAMAFWQATSPGAVLISNGLATMGFALPAGIARALHAPNVPTIVFTGDGGLMMCAGELAAAAQSGARVCVVVFNDASLSLIALKQRNRGMAEAGVGWSRADFASVARGFGLQAFTARTEGEYEQALRQALAADGPCLIDVHVDPSGYGAQSKALRG
jgi:acetolactate synthase-1/2/3 large subunit